jgi:hypothetical protein
MRLSSSPKSLRESRLKYVQEFGPSLPRESPLEGAEISLNCPDRTASYLYWQLGRTASSVKTDNEGRFTLPGVLPGMKFYLQIRKDKTFYSGEPKNGLLEIEPAQTLDLGDRRLKPQN